MKKGITVIIGCGLLLLIYFVLNRLGKDAPSTEDNLGTTSVFAAANNLPASYSPKSRPSAADAEVKLVPLAVSHDPGEIKSGPRPEYVWYTQPTSKGTIKNSKGEIIFQATDELPFVSMRSRGNVSQVIIVSANRNAFVIDPETKQRVALPKQPPEEGAKGFETWEWIDNNTLIAEYHVQAMGPDGKSVSCCQGHGVAETRLYSYNLKSNMLVRVTLPKQLEGTAFSIRRIEGNRSLEVVMLSNHLTDGKRVGWFNLSSSN